jgi:hypothetical protein
MKIARRVQVDADGNLWLQLPANLSDREVTVTVEAAEPAESSQSPEALGWPPGFFEQTAGAWEGEVLERPPQGDYEQRDWHLL